MLIVKSYSTQYRKIEKQISNTYRRISQIWLQFVMIVFLKCISGSKNLTLAWVTLRVRVWSLWLQGKEFMRLVSVEREGDG